MDSMRISGLDSQVGIDFDNVVVLPGANFPPGIPSEFQGAREPWMVHPVVDSLLG